MGGRGFRPVNRYDPVAKTWTDLGFPPLKMHHFQPVVHGSNVYVICAFEGDFPNETPIADIQIYDPVLNSWSTGSTIPAGRNRGSAGVVVYEDRIYVVGGNTLGHNGGYVPWFDRYDPVADTWTALPDAPHARDHFTAVVIGNKLYAAGGRQTEQPNPFLNTIGPVDVYDFTSGTWSSMPEPIPTERAGTMTVARAEHLIVVGGETTVGANDETEALDVGTGEWLTLPPLIDSRHSGGAVLHQDAIYVASGSGDNGGFPELKTQERLALAGLLPTSPSNLVANGDLDAGLAGWEDLGDLTLAAGLGGIETPALDLQNGWAGLVGAAAPQKTYRLTGHFQASGTSGGASLGLEYLGGGGAVLGAKVSTLAAASAWTSFEVAGTTPVGTSQVRAKFQATGDWTLFVDDVVVMEKPAELPRLGVPANPYALLPAVTTGPVIGQVWDPIIDHANFAPASALDVLAFGLTQLNVPTPDGTILINLASTFFFLATPGAPFAFPLPADAGLVGLGFSVQGASIEGLSAPLTNALDVTIQARLTDGSRRETRPGPLRVGKTGGKSATEPAPARGHPPNSGRGAAVGAGQKVAF